MTKLKIEAKSLKELRHALVEDVIMRLLDEPRFFDSPSIFQLRREDTPQHRPDGRRLRDFERTRLQREAKMGIYYRSSAIGNFNPTAKTLELFPRTEPRLLVKLVESTFRDYMPNIQVLLED